MSVTLGRSISPQWHFCAALSADKVISSSGRLSTVQLLQLEISSWSGVARRQSQAHPKPPSLADGAVELPRARRPVSGRLKRKGACRAIPERDPMLTLSIGRLRSRAAAHLNTCGATTCDGMMRSRQRGIGGQLLSRCSSAIMSRPESRRGCPDCRNLIMLSARQL